MLFEGTNSARAVSFSSATQTLPSESTAIALGKDVLVGVRNSVKSRLTSGTEQQKRVELCWCCSTDDDDCSCDVVGLVVAVPTCRKGTVVVEVKESDSQENDKKDKGNRSDDNESPAFLQNLLHLFAR